MKDEIKFKIIPYTDQYKTKTREFISNILEIELGHHGIKRPDIDSIKESYQDKGGNFWIALDDDLHKECKYLKNASSCTGSTKYPHKTHFSNDKIVGTIALENYGNGYGYLKRMCVDKKFRGTGLADELLLTLLGFAKRSGYKKIYLNTMENMSAANKFYQKHGFKKIDKFPSVFPEVKFPQFGTTNFYVYRL